MNPTVRPTPGLRAHRDRRLGLVLALHALLAPAAPWATGLAGAAEPGFRALAVDGKTTLGRLSMLHDGRVVMEGPGGKKTEIRWNDLVLLERDAPTPVTPPDREQLALPDGDWLAQIALGATTDASLEAQSDPLGKLTIPIECVLGVILSPPAQSTEFEALRTRLTAEPRATEVVWLKNGDALTGGFLGLKEQKVLMRIDGKSVDVDRAGVIAIGFDPSLAAYPARSIDAELVLRDGSRLGVTAPSLDDGAIKATTRFGQTLKVGLGEIVRLRARTPSVVYLTERKPERADYVSYVGPKRPFRADRTVDGQPLRLAGQFHDRGLGAQSRTILAYRIEPGDRRFQALVGVDERAGPLASVAFRVLVDRRECFHGPALSEHDAPKPIDIDLTGGKYLILITEFGDRGDVRDLADWAEARLIR